MRSGFTKCAVGLYTVESRKQFFQQGLPVGSNAPGVSILSILAILPVLHELIARSAPCARRTKYLQVYPYFGGISFLLDICNAVDFHFDQMGCYWQIPARSISYMGVILFEMVVC